MGFPIPAPDQLRLDGLEERLDNGVVIAVALATHGRLQAVAVRSFLVVVRRALATTVVIRTASLRNSSVLPVPMLHLLCCTVCDKRSGTEPRLKWPGQTDLCCQAIRAHRT